MAVGVTDSSAAARWKLECAAAASKARSEDKGGRRRLGLMGEMYSSMDKKSSVVMRALHA
ncbi:hypothetical protein GCM10023165_18450 [Variovorax defluvii]|uniref:Uncharacterized protein n=1 Tax=Variovorax defluvii TaxID=913761 RepID=A0ABP8HGY7_9BURK